MKKSLGPKLLGLPAPAWVVGTYGPDEKPNAMTVAWASIFCSAPPCVGLSIGQRHYTHENILARRAFTVNVGSDRYVKEIDYFGLVSGRDADKFSVTGLTPVRSEKVDAPYVAEFPLVLECVVYEEHDAGWTTYFVGEIRDVKADEDVLGENGLPELGKVRPLIYGSGVRQYHCLGDHLAPAYSIGRELETEDN
ncbi:MAG: flavin reductase family protein [Proteobacteria bacterium]|nr:flavin reductase family protein [Pseudomonadota bacterium]MBU1740071.1 flavin reductase family protein [Pseudomonadota bacterium]